MESQLLKLSCWSHCLAASAQGLATQAATSTQSGWRKRAAHALAMLVCLGAGAVQAANLPSISAPLPQQFSKALLPVISANYAPSAGARIEAKNVVLLLDGKDVSRYAQRTASAVRYMGTSPLSQGPHQVLLKVTDSNQQSTSLIWAFIQDSQGPLISPQIAASNAVVGAEYSDEGTGVDAASAVLLVDGVNVSAQAEASAKDIRYTPTQALPPGNHTASLTVSDFAKNSSTKSWIFVVGPTDPVKNPEISLQSPRDSYLPPSENILISARYAGFGAAIDPSKTRLWLDGVEVSALATISASEISYLPASIPSYGLHQVKLRVSDLAGRSSEASWQFAMATAPTISDLSPKDVMLPGASQPTISAKFSDSQLPLDPASLKMLVDGVDVSAQASISSNVISYRPAAALSQGLHTVYLSLANSAKLRTQALWNFEVDVVKTYQLEIVSPQANATSILPSIEVAASAQANTSYVSAMSVNGIAMVPSNTESGIPRFVADVALQDGANQINVVATFADGKTETHSASVTYHAMPVISITSPLDKSTLGPVNPFSPRNLTGNVERPVTITGRSSKPVASVSINQQAATVSSDGLSFSFPNFFLHEGTNLLNAVASDAYGNIATASITVSVDQTAPLLSIEAPLKDAVTSNTKIDVRGVVNDAIEGWANSPNPVVKVLNLSNNQSLDGKVVDRFYIVEDVPLEIGANRLKITATDQVGNSRSQEVLVSRVAAGSKRLTLLGGNHQRGAINALLAKPLIIVALDQDGNVLANLPVAFDVLRGTGNISLEQQPPAGQLTSRHLIVNTDAAGRAQVWLRLGLQSGEAGNMVRASHPDIGEAVTFSATTEKGEPAFVRADGVLSQFAETGASAMEPLSAIVTDAAENRLANIAVKFTVDVGDASFVDANGNASTSITAQTDKNGLATARPLFGIEPGTVRISAVGIHPQSGAEVEGVHYQISVLRQQDGPTRFSGKVLSHTGQALPGVRVSLGRTSLVSTTDNDGNFSFDSQVPAGKLDLFIDGRTANVQTNQFPALHFEALAVRGQNNSLSHPIYLPPLLLSETKQVGGAQDVSLKIPGFEGFEMIVKANSVTFPDGSHVGNLVVSPVQQDKLPMVPPGGYSGFMSPAWTIQPSGTRFDPPIQVKIPNSLGLPPGQSREIFQWDHDLATFAPMGRATVSEDGALLISDANSGITKAGWGGPPDPPPAPPKCGTSNPPELETPKIKVKDFKDEEDVIEFIDKPLRFEAEVKHKNCTPKVEWDFAGTKKVGRFVTHSFSEPKKVSVKLQVTCKAYCKDASDPSAKDAARDVFAAKVEIKEAWSDQFSGTEGHGWNPARQTGNVDKPYALMGVRADDTGRIRVKFKLEPNESVIKKKLRFGLSSGSEAKGESGGNTDGTGEITGDTVYIKLASPPLDDFFPVAGLDKNDDKKLSQQELAKSGPEKAWKFRMISNAENAKAITEYTAGVVRFGAIGQSWLSSFRDGVYTPLGGLPSPSQVRRREEGLSHVAGVEFSGSLASASGPSRTVTFGPNSTIVQEVLNNNGFKNWIQDGIKGQTLDYVREVNEKGFADRTYAFSNKAELGIKLDKLTLIKGSTGFLDLYAAIGDALEMRAIVKIHFEKVPLLPLVKASKIEVIGGEITDLFDWDYDLTAAKIDWGKYLPVLDGLPSDFDLDLLGVHARMARAGAKIQAGHLGMGSSRPGGLVFLNKYYLGKKDLPPFVFSYITP